MKKLFSILMIMFVSVALFSQEALKSTEEEYYDFLSLTGVVERPTLGYRTLSDSVWTYNDVESFEENEDGTFTKVLVLGEESDQNIWKNNNLGTTYTLWSADDPADNWFVRGIKQSLTMRIYGPEWFNSYNTAAPYGQNDGALWQGKGYNTALTAGVRFEGYGFEATFKPQLSFSQNLAFEYIAPNYTGSNFAGKAAVYGYYGVCSIDAPQRFGDKAFWNFDWGDTEVRWTWNTLTVGFGTQTIWLGSAKLNPIIHSNNAASYPKIDLGIRKTKLTMPYFGWDLGDIEARCWWGKLSESDWFDNNESNNENLITGFSVYYQLPFMKDFTIGMNRTMLSKWTNISPYTALGIIIPGISSLTSGGDDTSDQRFSIVFDYVNQAAEWELYFEWARNDFSPNFDYILRYPFHTEGWTFGTEKAFNLPFDLKGALLLELTFLECSADYDRLIGWYTTFYSHDDISQGYTNKGQWLGAGIGTGGNSQYLGFKVYFPKGSITFFGQRRNPDLDYSMFIDSRKHRTDFNNRVWTAESNIRANIDFGIDLSLFCRSSFCINQSLVITDEHNPLNTSNGANHSIHRCNVYYSLKLKWEL